MLDTFNFDDCLDLSIEKNNCHHLIEIEIADTVAEDICEGCNQDCSACNVNLDDYVVETCNTVSGYVTKDLEQISNYLGDKMGHVGMSIFEGKYCGAYIS